MILIVFGNMDHMDIFHKVYILKQVVELITNLPSLF